MPYIKRQTFLFFRSTGINIWTLLVLINLSFPISLYSQAPSAPTDSLISPKIITQQQLKIAAGGLALGYTGLLIALSQTWYAQSDQTSFHFFNDNREWKQLDKIGHFGGAFHEGRLGIAALRAAQVPEKKAIIYGSLLGFILQSPIELLDGYAADYGASAGDLGANALGSLALMAQNLVWQEVKIMPKFSFRRSPYAQLRPNVLGKTLPEQILKDYNGQTYWLSVDVSSFLAEKSRYPKWLNLAMGYGAEGMVYGDDRQNQKMGFDAYRQYYLALDLNLLHIKTRSKFLKSAFQIISIIHLPAPAIEYNRQRGLLFHAVQF